MNLLLSLLQMQRDFFINTYLSFLNCSVSKLRQRYTHRYECTHTHTYTKCATDALPQIWHTNQPGVIY